MFSQYRNRIIALFLTVCLLVTSLCVPVSAAGDPATMLYNGVELPNIESVWTDKVTYPYAEIRDQNGEASNGYVLLLTDKPCYVNPELGANLYCDTPTKHSTWVLSDDMTMWEHYQTGVATGGRFVGGGASYYFWANHDVINVVDNSVWLAATAPAPVGTMTYYTTSFGSDYSHTTFEVGGLSENDTYFIRGYCYQDSSLIATVDSPSWTGSGTYCTVEFSGLTPSTTYDFEYVLYVNDTETSVTYTNSVTTLDASSGGDDSGGGGGTGDGGGASGGCTECPSILSTILSAITNQSTFLSNWKQDWSTRMDGFEESILSAVSALAPVPDPAETALKTATAETTKAVTEEVFADDSPTKVTASDVKDVAQVGSAAAQMFNPGVGIGAFFDALNNVSFLSVFTQEMVNSMNTVNAVSAISGDGFDSTEYYHKNLEEIRDFVNGG